MTFLPCLLLLPFPVYGHGPNWWSGCHHRSQGRPSWLHQALWSKQRKHVETPQDLDESNTFGVATGINDIDIKFRCFQSHCWFGGSSQSLLVFSFYDSSLAFQPGQHRQSPKPSKHPNIQRSATPFTPKNHHMPQHVPPESSTPCLFAVLQGKRHHRWHHPKSPRGRRRSTLQRHAPWHEAAPRQPVGPENRCKV